MQLNALERKKIGKAVRAMRSLGKLPAVLYGRGITPQSLFVLHNPFKKVLAEAGESTLVDLYVNGEPHKVLIADVQYHPVSGNLIHVDFREVKMTEKLETKIALKFVGESPAVKGLGGVLVKNLNEVKVRCLPSALVHEIEIDLSSLKDFGNAVHISDMIIPDGIEILESQTEVVVTAMAPREEETVAAPTVEVPDLSAIKTVGEEKRAAKAAEKTEEEAEKKTKNN